MLEINSRGCPPVLSKWARVANHTRFQLHTDMAYGQGAVTHLSLSEWIWQPHRALFLTTANSAGGSQLIISLCVSRNISCI